MAIQELTATKRVYNALSQQHCYIQTSHTYNYIIIIYIYIYICYNYSTLSWATCFLYHEARGREAPEGE